MAVTTFKLYNAAVVEMVTAEPEGQTVNLYASLQRAF